MGVLMLGAAVLCCSPSALGPSKANNLGRNWGTHSGWSPCSEDTVTWFCWCDSTFYMSPDEASSWEPDAIIVSEFGKSKLTFIHPHTPKPTQVTATNTMTAVPGGATTSRGNRAMSPENPLAPLEVGGWHGMACHGPN